MNYFLQYQNIHLLLKTKKSIFESLLFILGKYCYKDLLFAKVKLEKKEKKNPRIRKRKS